MRRLQFKLDRRGLLIAGEDPRDAESWVLVEDLTSDEAHLIAADLEFAFLALWQQSKERAVR